jgi:hypothetical protein
MLDILLPTNRTTRIRMNQIMMERPRSSWESQEWTLTTLPTKFMMVTSKVYGGIRSLPNLSCYPRICLGGPRKLVKNLGANSRFLAENWTQELPPKKKHFHRLGHDVCYIEVLPNSLFTVQLPVFLDSVCILCPGIRQFATPGRIIHLYS